MPSITPRNVVKIGDSHYVALPPAWLRWATKEKGVKQPKELEIEILGDHVLTVRLKEEQGEDKKDE